MRNKRLWLGGFMVLSMIFIAGCVANAVESTVTPDFTVTSVVTASTTAQPKETTVPTLASTRTATLTQAVQATYTESVSGFQRMIRSLPTAEFVAGFYPDSVEIVYFDTPIRVNNFTFAFSHSMESGLYLDKRFDIEKQWAAFEGYHPWPDYTIALYAEFVDETLTLEEVKTAAMDDLLTSAARFGLVLSQSGEIITIDEEQAVLTYVTLANDQGYLQFLTLDSLQMHVQGGVLEVSMMTAFLQPSEEDLALLAGDVQLVLEEIFRSFETFDWENNLTYDYTLFTGLCPTESDESYGYTQENPIRMVILAGNETDQAFSGPYMANAYFETLLYEGEPVSYVRLGSISTDTTILDSYEVTAPGMAEPVILYVDQYSQALYTVPAGFQCSGLMYPELFIEE